MKHPKDLHPEARALLVMTTGMATAGLPSLLEQYGYRMDETDSTVWRLEGETGDGAGLVFADDFTEVALIGDSRENAENVNYVLSRGGWSGAELITADAAIEEELLSVLASIEIADIQQLWKPSEAPRKDLPSSNSPPATPPEEERRSSAVEALEESVGELQTALSAVERLEKELALLVANNKQLEEEADKLRRQLKSGGGTAQGSAVSVEDQSLVEVMEKHLVRQLDLSNMEGTDLVKELRNAGYEIKLSLAKR